MVFFVTKSGFVKRTSGAEFDSSVRTIAATKLQAEDEIVFCGTSDEAETAVLQSKEGFFIKFPVSEVPELKKTAVGVRGMKLADNDSVEQGFLLENSREFTIDFHGRKLTLNRLKLSKRGGKGTKNR